jgi:hypothetical protein
MFSNISTSVGAKDGNGGNITNICKQDSEKDGKFVVNRYIGSRKSPYDWEASHFLREEPITKPLK